jgi:urease subunit alpha
MVLNAATPRIDVSPETFDVAINGERIDIKPAASFSLGQLYWFS